MFGDDAALLQRQRGGEWGEGESGPAGGGSLSGPAAHRRQERSDLVGPQRFVTDAAVVVVLKSEADRVQHASASTVGLVRFDFFHLVGFGADAAPEFT